MNMLKKTLSFILTALMLIIILPAQYSLAAENPSINLGSSSLIDNKYYYSNAVVSGDNIRTILISFSDNVTSGDKINLPESTPGGFTVSSSSLGNNYTKRINLDAGIPSSSVQEYIRGIGFSISSKTQSAVVTVTTDSIGYDTFFNIDTKHYYQYIPDTSSSWIEAYEAAKNMTYMGRTGYLATIMNQNEDEYVNSLSNGKTGWLGGTILTNSGSKVDSVGGTAGSLLYYSSIATTSVVSTGWYWACGPEIGTTFYNTNSLYPNATSSNADIVDNANTSSYFNWARGTVSYEPNNQTAYRSSTSGDYETCLTTLKISGNIGEHGTSFSWNDKHYDTAGTGEWDAKGYFVEYGNLPLGDNTGASPTFASDSGTLHQPSGDIFLTTVTWTGATTYNCGIDLPDAAEMVTISTDSGYFTVPSLGGALTFLGGTSGSNYINTYSSAIHFDSAVFSFTDASAAEALLSDIIYSIDNTKPQTIRATSSTVSPNDDDIYFEGHFYRYISGSIDWQSAVLAAGETQDPYFGGRGYIATAASQNENSILLKLTDTGGSGSDHWYDAWMGGLWQRNTGTVSSPNIIRGIDGNEITYSHLSGATADQRKNLLLDYTITFSDFNPADTSTYINAKTDTVKYYWIDGPEAGQEIAYNTDGFSPWHFGEPNCGDFVYIGWEGAYWDDLGAYPDDSGDSFDKLDGYIVEFSGFDGGSAAGIVKDAVKTTSVYTATVNTRKDDVLTAASGTVELRQSGITVAAAESADTGIYTAVAHNGTYDIYIGGEDTGENITISDAAGSKTINYYTVSFNDWDGTVLKTQTVRYGNSAEAPDDPERTGHTFTGWDNTYDEITNTITITAQYTINYYTVSFNTNGGSTIENQNVKYGYSATKPETPVMSGYKFSGWYSDSSLSKTYSFSTKVTEDLILYAKWTKKEPVTVIPQTSEPQSLTLNTTFKFAKGNTWECVTDNFSMLGSSVSNTHIVWASSDANIVHIEQNSDGAATGFVTRPQYNDTSVIITATATKGEDSLSKTFLLIIKRQGVTKNELRTITNRSADIQAGNSTKSEPIYQTLLNDGTKIDYVSVTADTIRKLIAQNGTSDNIVVTIDSISNSPADEFAFEVLPDTVSTIAQNGLGITLTSPAGTIMFSAETLKQAAQNEMSVFFRIVNAADQSEDAQEAFRSDGTVFSISNISGEVFGTPKTIQTNMENLATTIILPLDGLTNEQLKDETFLKTLCIYVEHEDGTTQLVNGTLVYTNDVPTQIRFSISKFSRFQIVSIERSAASPWIWIVCIAGGILLISAIILLAVSRKRNLQARR